MQDSKGGGGVYTEIYIDMVFLINLVMDYLILWIVKVMTKKTCEKRYD